MALERSLQLVRLCAGVRQMSDNACKTKLDVPSAWYKMKANQEKFKLGDGIPVFIKGGAVDKILYQATMLLSVIGVSWSLKVFYELSFPKKD